MRSRIQTRAPLSGRAPGRWSAVLLVSAAVALPMVAGCAGDPGRDPNATAGPRSSEAPTTAPTTAQATAPEKPVAQVTVYGEVSLHENGGRRLLAESAYSPGSRTALMSGALSANDSGCFGVGVEGGAFAQVVFPHGTTINSDGDLVFDEHVFAEGDGIAMGGGGGNPPTGLASDAFEACGFTADGAFIGSDEVSARG